MITTLLGNETEHPNQERAREMAGGCAALLVCAGSVAGFFVALTWKRDAN